MEEKIEKRQRTGHQTCARLKGSLKEVMYGSNCQEHFISNTHSQYHHQKHQRYSRQQYSHHYQSQSNKGKIAFTQTSIGDLSSISASTVTSLSGYHTGNRSRSSTKDSDSSLSSGGLEGVGYTANSLSHLCNGSHQRSYSAESSSSFIAEEKLSSSAHNAPLISLPTSTFFRSKQDNCKVNYKDMALIKEETNNITMDIPYATSSLTLTTEPSTSTSTVRRRSHRPRGCRGGRKNRKNKLTATLLSNNITNEPAQSYNLGYYEDEYFNSNAMASNDGLRSNTQLNHQSYHVESYQHQQQRLRGAHRREYTNYCNYRYDKIFVNVNVNRNEHSHLYKTSGQNSCNATQYNSYEGSLNRSLVQGGEIKIAQNETFAHRTVQKSNVELLPPFLFNISTHKIYRGHECSNQADPSNEDERLHQCNQQLQGAQRNNNMNSSFLTQMGGRESSRPFVGADNQLLPSHNQDRRKDEPKVHRDCTDQNFDRKCSQPFSMKKSATITSDSMTNLKSVERCKQPIVTNYPMVIDTSLSTISSNRNIASTKLLPDTKTSFPIKIDSEEKDNNSNIEKSVHIRSCDYISYHNPIPNQVDVAENHDGSVSPSFDGHRDNHNFTHHANNYKSTNPNDRVFMEGSDHKNTHENGHKTRFVTKSDINPRKNSPDNLNNRNSFTAMILPKFDFAYNNEQVMMDHHQVRQQIFEDNSDVLLSSALEEKEYFITDEYGPAMEEMHMNGRHPSSEDICLHNNQSSLTSQLILDDHHHQLRSHDFLVIPSGPSDNSSLVSNTSTESHSTLDECAVVATQSTTRKYNDHNTNEYLYPIGIVDNPTRSNQNSLQMLASGGSLFVTSPRSFLFSRHVTERRHEQTTEDLLAINKGFDLFH